MSVSLFCSKGVRTGVDFSEQRSDANNAKTVLLCIDLQEFPPSSSAPDEVKAFQAHQNKVVVPNVSRLQTFCRAHSDEYEVIHSRIQSLTRDGRDRGALHKRLGIHLPPDSAGSEFLPALGPVGDELVFNKTASNVFLATNLHFVLSNMSVRNIIIVGLLTDECIASSAKAAADLGYSVTVVSDACAAARALLHHTALETLSRYTRVCTTAQVLSNTQVPTSHFNHTLLREQISSSDCERTPDSGDTNSCSC